MIAGNYDGRLSRHQIVDLFVIIELSCKMDLVRFIDDLNQVVMNYLLKLTFISESTQLENELQIPWKDKKIIW